MTLLRDKPLRRKIENYIMHALVLCNGRKDKACKQLGIAPGTLRNYLKSALQNKQDNKVQILPLWEMKHKFILEVYDKVKLRNNPIEETAKILKIHPKTVKKSISLREE